jgi:glycosyltransferase involved in cell wall biosynthesis
MVVGRALDVAVVRERDLEARELFMFDQLEKRGLIRARALGHRPATPYGLEGVAMPVRFVRSPAALIDRLPAGRQLRHRVERRTGRDLSPILDFASAVGDDVDILNPRELFSRTSLRSCELAAERPSARVVVSVFENIPFRYDDDPALSAIKAAVMARADRFIANSPGARRALEVEGVPAPLIDAIPPAIDTERFVPGSRSRATRRSWGASDEDVVVLFAGRLLREKGVVELLVAIAPLLRPPPVPGEGTAPPLLVIQGSGGERPRIEVAARALGVADRVRFAPWVETAAMPDVYRSADVVVLPSLATPYWEEQYGFNLVEALACGRPVVGTRTGAIPWVLGDAGILVDGYDGEQLLRAIESLARDRRRRADLGTKARASAVERFSVDAAGVAHVRAFERALGQEPRCAGR